MNTGFDNFEAAEQQTLSQFVDDCKEAWDWILVSYCLKHGEQGDVTQVGYGCSWGTGAGAGNAGFKKGVAVEEHMDVLALGQDPLDIKNIDDEEWLIESAKNFAMQGVSGKSDGLLADLEADKADKQE